MIITVGNYYNNTEYCEMENSVINLCNESSFVCNKIYMLKINLGDYPQNVINGWLFLLIRILDNLDFYFSLHSNISKIIFIYLFLLKVVNFNE